MKTTTHPLEREEVMAYLDGEVETARAALIAAHLETCAECAELARELRLISKRMVNWQVEPSPDRLSVSVEAAINQQNELRTPTKPVRWKLFPQWAWVAVGSLAVLLLIVGIATPNFMRSRTAANATSSVSSLRSLNTACVQYASTYAIGYPRSLSQLGPGSPASKDAADLIDGVLASGVKSGYRFIYTPGAVDAAGKILDYTISAEPVSEVTGDRYFFTDASGVIRTSTRGPATALDAPIAGTEEMTASNRIQQMVGRALDQAQSLPSGPMIIRAAALTVSVAELDSARAALEKLLREHGGHVAQLNAQGSRKGSRSIDATLRIPSSRLDSAVAELKKLGRVESESLTGEEVTKQHADLVARQSNAQVTEKRLKDVLANRTGKVADVLEVEREVARVRQEIEQMDAERKHLENRVAFATVQLRLAEEYQAQLNVAPPSAGSQLRNAVVEGYEAGVETLLGLALFVLRAGPTLLVWGLLLFWPVRWGVRRMRAAQRTVERAA